MSREPVSGRLRRWFPNLSPAAWKTSEADPAYNCVAWALGETDRFWEPLHVAPYYWPAGVPRDYTVASWVQLFRTQGYETCASAEFEPGYEKLAIYFDARTSEARHVARQLVSGAWTSKLGKFEDIAHPSLDELAGDEYGHVGPILRREAGETSAP